MAAVATNGKPEAEDDWEYEDEDADDYEWEYSEEEEEEEVANGGSAEKAKAVNDDEEEEEDEEEEDLPDPFSTAPLKTAAPKPDVKPVTTNGSENGGGGENGTSKKKHRSSRTRRDSDENGEENGGSGRRHHKKHKKSRHLERIEVFKKKDDAEDEYRNKKIHVRSKDPLRIAKQFEKGAMKKSKGGKGRVAPPPQKINTICKICGKEPYLVERLEAEKSYWHKTCFRCKQCNKSLNLDTYMSHEGVIYCKPHHRELFQPKVVKNDIIDVNAGGKNAGSSLEAVARHKEQEKRMETIIRESKPVDLGDEVVKSSRVDREAKYAGLEDLDVGSKFKMFEKSDDDRERAPASDRYGIMEKLKRLQEGADLDDLLAEMDDEMPSYTDDEEEDDDLYGLTEVQKKTLKAETNLFAEERRDKMATDKRAAELKNMREKLMSGSTDNAMDQIQDLLNASANKYQKTKIDVRSDNAKKFREMFDKGEIPEGLSSTDRTIAEKEAELDQMRKGKREQREYFKKLEEGKTSEGGEQKGPKLLVGKLKGGGGGEGGEGTGSAGADMDEEVPEMASLSSRFAFFENHKEKKEEEEEERRKRSRRSPPRLSKSHIFEDPNDEEEDLGVASSNKKRPEVDHARRECKASRVLNKFKEMEQRVLNGEEVDEVGDRPKMKRFTPPRGQSGSEYSDSDDDSDYTGSSYTSSSYSDSESEEEDETLRAIRESQRANQLRAKFEKWENSKDAQDQARQIMIHDENGECLETAHNLKARFEALQLHEAQNQQTPPPVSRKKFQVKRFK